MNKKGGRARGRGAAARYGGTEILGVKGNSVIVLGQSGPFAEQPRPDRLVGNARHIIKQFELRLTACGRRRIDDRRHHIGWLMPCYSDNVRKEKRCKPQRGKYH